MAFSLSNVLAPFGAGDSIENAAKASATGIQTGLTDLQNQYAQGRGAIADYYTRALQPYMALQQPATGGYQAYADASGANGLAGQMRAQQNFTTDPGYQFSRDEALKALAAGENARGVAAGNTGPDAAKYAAGYANQAYGDYVSRLAPWLNQGDVIAGGMANINTGAGNAINQSFTGQGNQALTANTNIGAANAQGAMAPMIYGSNMDQFALQAAKTAASFMPGGGFANLFGGNTPGIAPPGTNMGAAPGRLNTSWQNPDQYGPPNPLLS